MQQTFFALLTNKKARRPRAIKASLNKEFATAGAEWFDSSQKTIINAKVAPAKK